MSQPVLILLIIAVYAVVWLTVSYFSSRGADNSTFFSGNRKMPWPLVAVAMVGAPITGVTFISVPGMVLTKGFSYLQMCLGFIVGYLVISLVLIPLYYRLNIVSIYGFLERRFGRTSRQTGAWLFFVSKIFGISIRFLMVCAMLQLLVFDPLGIPYIFSVIAAMGAVWVSTFRGGVKSVIWGDVLKSFCLISSIALCLYVIMSQLGFGVADLPSQVLGRPESRIFHFDDPSDSKYFWKQFVAGVFIVIAMTGLDQDMMQRTLACRSARDSRKNMIVSGVMQAVVISFILVLGVLMTVYLVSLGETLPERSDNLFATVAFHEGMPVLVGILFVVGLVSATYSSVASALTSMTTAMTVDILPARDDASQATVKKRRILVHTAISLVMVALVVFFYYLNEDDAISTVYTLISYTDGPILGLFLFGLLSRRPVNERWLPLVCIMAPVLSWMVQAAAASYLDYQVGYELLLINAGFTFAGLCLLASPIRKTAYLKESGRSFS